MHRKVKIQVGDQTFHVGSCVLTTDDDANPNCNGDIFISDGMTIPSGEITFKHDDEIIGKVLSSYEEK